MKIKQNIQKIKRDPTSFFFAALIGGVLAYILMSFIFPNDLMALKSITPAMPLQSFGFLDDVIGISTTIMVVSIFIVIGGVALIIFGGPGGWLVGIPAVVGGILLFAKVGLVAYVITALSGHLWWLIPGGLMFILLFFKLKYRRR